MALTGKLKEAYNRAVTEGRFENVEARDGKEARARAELRHEQSQQPGGEQDNGNGNKGVSSDLNDAYQRAVKGERFEGAEARDGKDARARKQLDWEKTAGGKKWLREQGLTGEQGGGGQGADTPAAPSMEYKNDEDYQGLPQYMKDLVDMMFTQFSSGTEEDIRRMSLAIEKAKAVADPIFKSTLALSQASVIDTIAKTTHDYEFGQRAIKRVRDELLEDVSLRGEELGLEEKSEIARAMRNLERNVLNLRDEAALKGVTFGEGRYSLSEDIGQAQVEAADVIQSIRRKANFERKRLAIRAERGERTAQEELQESQFGRGINLRSIARETEQLLGTREAEDLLSRREEFTGQEDSVRSGLLQGGVSALPGSLEEQRQGIFSQNLRAFFMGQDIKSDKL